MEFTENARRGGWSASLGFAVALQWLGSQELFLRRLLRERIVWSSPPSLRLFANLRPQALQSVFEPLGPFLHSGLSVTKHTSHMRLESDGGGCACPVARAKPGNGSFGGERFGLFLVGVKGGGRCAATEWLLADPDLC